MVELGDRQFDENRSAATEASKVCDVVAVVGETNRRALCEGLSEGGLNGDAVLTFATRERAFNQLESQYRAGDVILIENDLTDWYEDRTTF